MPAPSVRPTADYSRPVGTVQDPFVVQYGSVQAIDPRSLGIDHPAFVQLHAHRHWVGTDTKMSTLVHFTAEQARELAVRLLQAAATADGINAYDAERDRPFDQLSRLTHLAETAICGPVDLPVPVPTVQH